MPNVEKKTVYVIAVINSNSNFKGRRFGLQFNNGTAQTDDAQKAKQFKALGYTVTALKDGLEPTE